MKKLVVLSGAGVSAESGLSTFRGAGGLWEGYDINEVASIEGWISNPELVLDFYNMRRKQAFEAKPNQAHIIIAQLQEYFDVQVITQNVDDLHEKAGSKNVLHLHGKLSEAKSEHDDSFILELGNKEITFGDCCPNGHQLRPNIVWFGEMVPAIEEAIKLVSDTDIIVVVGTSLLVYPAASLVDYVSSNSRLFLVDPNPPSLARISDEIDVIEENATTGMLKLKQKLLNEYF